MAEPTLPTLPIPYEPPRIERVLSPEDLEREFLYAGTTKIALSPPV
jgi:hypothetical protein